MLPPVKNRKSFVSQLLEDGRYGCFLGCNGGGRPQSHLGLDHPAFFFGGLFLSQTLPSTMLGMLGILDQPFLHLRLLYLYFLYF